MITLTDEYEVAGTILEIPLDLIRPATDNPRSDLGDLDGLAASIREVGVLQAISVVPEASGETFTIMMGARRHAAALIAGKETIPSIVLAGPEDLRRAKAMLIENVQREPLPPVDEARAFDQLEQKFGLTQTEIAESVGCSQAHVSKRLALLTLPQPVRWMVDTKRLTISDAVELAKIADDPDKILETVQGWETLEPDERRYRIEDAVDEHERSAAREIALAEWTAQGVPVLDDDQTGRAHRITTPDEFEYRKHLELKKNDAKRHVQEPCHAVALDWQGDKFAARPYCVSADRHDPDGPSTIKATVAKKSPAAQGKSPETIERERSEKEITKHRTAFVHDIVRARKLDKSLVIACVLRDTALSGHPMDLAKRAQTLGIDLKGRNPQVALADFVEGNTDAMTRACLAALLTNATSPNANATTLQLLDRLGYELSPAEQADRDTRAQEAADLDAVRDADEALDRARDRAVELNATDHPRLVAIQTELDEGVSSTRATELQGELDAMFIELNDIQPGDVVDHDGEGHTIERVADIDTFTHDANTATTDDVLCAYPGCSLNEEHDGDHDTTPAYVKPPKDCSNAEAWARDQIDTVLTERPDDEEVVAIHQELLAGVEEPRAVEIRTRLRELQVLDRYLTDETGSVERQCRKLIEQLPADHARVMELQQELYRGVDEVVANRLRRELKEIRTKTGTVTP